MDKHHSAVLAALVVALIWGLSFLSTKVALASFPPMTLAVLRFIVAVIVLAPLALFSKGGLRLRLKDLPLMLISALSGITFYFLCENNGIALLTASESSLVIGTIPVITMLADRLALGTRLPGRAYTGAVLSFVGVAFIVAPSLGSGGRSSLLGFLFMAGSAVCWVGYALVTKPLSARYSGISITFWQSFFGLLGCIPFALAEHPLNLAATPTAWMNVLYLGLISSALGYLLYIVAINHLGAGRSSVFLNLVPIVSVVAAYILLGERLSVFALTGGAVAIAGVYLATLPGKAAKASA